MRLTLALLFTLLSACVDIKLGKTSDPAGSLSTEEREALYQQACEGARQSREQCIATTRSALQRQFDTNIPRCPTRNSMSWSMMRWRRGCGKRLTATDWIPRGLPLIVCLPNGDIRFTNCY